MKNEKIIKWNIELEEGDIIVTRKGDCFIKLGDKLLGKRGFFKDSYKKNLLDGDNMEEFDVMEVYTIDAHGLGLDKLLTASTLQKVFTPVWKREEE